MKRFLAKLLLLHFFVIFVVSCSTHTHVVGEGSQTGTEISKRQWYVAYGLATLNDIDTNEMAGDATDYEITTQATFVDGLINVFTGQLTITCRTVTVKK
tara:strand:+ start:1074 stop:1370 length:297 start_codon:yes stop_codon:yes gene_type:complete